MLKHLFLEGYSEDYSFNFILQVRKLRLGETICLNVTQNCSLGLLNSCSDLPHTSPTHTHTHTHTHETVLLREVEETSKGEGFGAFFPVVLAWVSFRVKGFTP